MDARLPGGSWPPSGVLRGPWVGSGQTPLLLKPAAAAAAAAASAAAAVLPERLGQWGAGDGAPHLCSAVGAVVAAAGAGAASNPSCVTQGNE
eukprot:1160652-Pelagomonas_calceolata.AAC.6